MLEVEDIHTYYGESYVLQGLSLRVAEGQTVAILGRNGVGKTTLIRSLMGFTPPRRGYIRFRGEEITHRPSHEIARKGIGLVPQGRRIFASLTVEENLRVAAHEAERGWTLERVYDLFPQLRERRRLRGNRLSGGEQQMLAIGRALMTNPSLLLMDEPSEGLAPRLVQELGRTLQTLRAEGLSILLVEQNLPLALRVADFVYVMSKGTIVFEGTPAALRQAEDVRQRYLGV
ncbi:MAG: ABC transporter ATP-binding protein [Armatimonadota bacterium]|nr:ABC transporter ATP-binding protein [Armatimonadota bacterium]MDR7439073.1 ABC transporter ATP-binding protein [Armatimonadota bacterium]MDR7562990.1 ABC transporter ATP-binding protein [Armatimonadota bacterium]MDR7568813.1 ABC transporter ATP-binding protein [Armatimonadota bacterium]MDR7600834.1 ABC transporter ATP-binding protein [Armatimonadota bacterium]